MTASEGTPDQYEVEDAGNDKRIKIGDPDRTITGRHTYTIDYRVEGTLNGFADHDELYWNAIGSRVVRAHRAGLGDGRRARARQPGRVLRGAGALVASVRLGRAPTAEPPRSRARSARARASRWSSGSPRARCRRPRPCSTSAGASPGPSRSPPARSASAPSRSLAVVAGFALLVWRGGRDRRYVGSPVDVAFGNIGGEEEAVPLLERTETPVEFVPPDGLRPGQVGTLVDEVAHPLDVTATIIDLAVRGHLRIEEIPKEGWFGKPDWRLVQLERAATTCAGTSSSCSTGCSATGRRSSSRSCATPSRPGSAACRTPSTTTPSSTDGS